MCDGTTRFEPLMPDRGIDIAQRIPMSAAACVAAGMQSDQSPGTSSVVYPALLHANPQSPLVSTLSCGANDRADSPTIV